MSAESRSINDTLDYHTEQARWLSLRYSLGPISARSIETDRDGRPLVVRVQCERATITYTAGSAEYRIDPAPQGWKP